MTGIAGDAGDLNSDVRNVQFRASLRVTARITRLLDTFAPPFGTVLSSMFLFATLLSPFPNEEQETLDDVLRRVLSEKLAAFSDQLLQNRLSQIQAQLRDFSREVNFYGTFSDGNLRADRNRIYSILVNNNQDTSYAFLEEMGANFIDPSNANTWPLWQSDPELIANRIYSFYQVARDSINLRNRIGAIFARMGNVDTTDMTKEDRKRVENDRARSIFWRDGSVAATRSVAHRYLGVLRRPPPDESSGTARVLRALYQIQSHEERRMFDDFMRDDLGMRIPGRLLQIRNLYHNQYIVVSEGACPEQVLRSSAGQVWRTRGFRINAMCPYVETTPGAAGLTNTDWNKVFVVYGNGRSFTLWNVGEA